MKGLLDTSVLVAACVERHPRHLPAFEWLRKALSKDVEAVVAGPSLLETFSILARAPFNPGIGPKEAHKLIAPNITSIATVTALTAKEYSKILQAMAEKEFMGGIAHDGLIAFCAQKPEARKIVTSNTPDFNRLVETFGLPIEAVGL